MDKASDFWQKAPFVAQAASECNKLLASGLLEPATSTRLDTAQIRALYTTTVRHNETSAPAKRKTDGSSKTSAYSEAAIDTNEMQRLVARALPHPQHSLVITTTLVQFFEQRQEERDYAFVDYAALASQPDPLAPLAPLAPAAAPPPSRAAEAVAPAAGDDENIFSGKSPEQMADILVDKLGETQQQRIVLQKWAGEPWLITMLVEPLM